MSVDYAASVGTGYRVTPKMLETLSDEKMDEFYDSDWAICLNGWTGDSDYFFGICFNGYTEEGGMMEIPSTLTYNQDRYSKMVADYKYFFPNEVDYTCKNYMLFRVY